jgi:hypothetical protein
MHSPWKALTLNKHSLFFSLEANKPFENLEVIQTPIDASPSLHPEEGAPKVSPGLIPLTKINSAVAKGSACCYPAVNACYRGYPD